MPPARGVKKEPSAPRRQGRSAASVVAAKQEHVSDLDDSNAAPKIVLSDDDDDAMEDGPAEDPVVREIDVFLSPEFNTQLHLLQYPLQPVGGGANAALRPAPVAARLKPLHHLLELDYHVDHGGENIVPEKQRRTFVSQTIPIQTHLCLGRFLPHPSASVVKVNKEDLVDSDDDAMKLDAVHSGAALYLIPLQHLQQMRPSFDHVDASVPVSGRRRSSVGSTVSQPPENTEDADQRRPILYQRKETDRAWHTRKNSYAYYRSSVDSEPYTELRIVQGPETAARRVHESVRDDPILSPMTNSDYIRSLDYYQQPLGSSLNYPIQVRGDESTGAVDIVASLIPRVTRRLLRGTPVPYTILRNLFVTSSNEDGITVTDADLWSALAVCAVLVRGNLVLRSALVPSALVIDLSQQQARTGDNLRVDQWDDFHQTSCDPVASFPDPLVWTDVQRRARTFLLLLFEMNGTVDRRKLAHSYSSRHVSPQCWHQMLCTLGRFERASQKSSAGMRGSWRLKIDDDPTVTSQFPDEYALHQAYWGRQKKRYASRLKKYHNAPSD
jgi:RPC5 protein